MAYENSIISMGKLFNQIHVLGMHGINEIFLHRFSEANVNVQNALLIKKMYSR